MWRPRNGVRCVDRGRFMDKAVRVGGFDDLVAVRSASPLLSLCSSLFILVPSSLERCFQCLLGGTRDKVCRDKVRWLGSFRGNACKAEVPPPRWKMTGNKEKGCL
ncbi:hypothetical protein E2542_SST27653 [Spatholobus suberectus]|nr:hypothetical protein E2542_SST27653 [Spatholobus suberectus]